MALTHPFARGLLSLRIGVWVFSYTLFFTMLAASGSAKPGTPLYLVFLSLLGMTLSGATEMAVNRTKGVAASLRLLFVALAVIAVAILNAAADVATLGRAMAPSAAHDVRFFLLNGVASFTYLIWIHAFYAAGVWVVGASTDLVEKEKRLAEAETEAQRATLSALRSQVNPHFLFNSLNAAAALVATGRNKQAEELIVRLSEFFRSSLNSERPSSIPLIEEFDIIDAYLEVESARFPNRLEVRMDCPAELSGTLVPSFLLLPLAENAVKHAVAPSTAPVSLRISAAPVDGRLRLEVEDCGAEKPGAGDLRGEGFGLKNVSQRLNVIYGSAATFSARATETGFLARIELPLTEAGRQ